jgi:3-dehydroquinate synthase
MYMRGVALAMVPTTLLAMVDAHLGGKTGVNTPRAKNLAGAFHPPLLVLADPVVLDTLPDRELAGGYAEVVKTALIGDAALFVELERTLLAGDRGDQDRRRDQRLLARCVAACAAVKGGVVTRDPWELGERRVLNLGHTVGHALEAQRDLGLSHGEAVSLGLLVALRLSVRRGLAPASLLDRTRGLLAACGLPTVIPAHDAAEVAERLRLDKKRRGENLAFVICREPGRVEIAEDTSVDEALAALAEEQRCASS